MLLFNVYFSKDTINWIARTKIFKDSWIVLYVCRKNKIQTSSIIQHFIKTEKKNAHFQSSPKIFWFHGTEKMNSAFSTKNSILIFVMNNKIQFWFSNLFILCILLSMYILYTLFTVTLSLTQWWRMSEDDYVVSCNPRLKINTFVDPQLMFFYCPFEFPSSLDFVCNIATLVLFFWFPSLLILLFSHYCLIDQLTCTFPHPTRKSGDNYTNPLLPELKINTFIWITTNAFFLPLVSQAKVLVQTLLHLLPH